MVDSSVNDSVVDTSVVDSSVVWGWMITELNAVE